MIARNWNWWSTLPTFGRSDWDRPSPLFALGEASEPRIGVLSDHLLRPLAFEARGLTRFELDSLKSDSTFNSEFTQVFAVFEADKNSVKVDGSTPIPGNYVIDGARLTFIPRHPLRSGITYRAELRVQTGAIIKGHRFNPLTVQCEVTVPDSDEPQTAQIPSPSMKD